MVSVRGTRSDLSSKPPYLLYNTLPLLGFKAVNVFSPFNLTLIVKVLITFISNKFDHFLQPFRPVKLIQLVSNVLF